MKGDLRMPSRRRHRRAPTGDLAANDPAGNRWQVDPTSVPTLIQEIFSDTRTLPLVLISVASDTDAPRIDVDSLAEDLGEDAGLAILDSMDAATRLSDLVPSAFRCYGGAVRICWPSATPEDAPDRHPLLITKPGDDPDRTCRRIQALLRARGFLPDPPPNSAPWNGPEPATDGTENSTSRELREDLRQAHDRLHTLSAENTDLRKTVRGLTDQVEDLTRRLYGTTIYTDPEQQLRYEISHAWLTTYPEADREQYPLATYRFGPDFLTSVAAIEGVERHRLVAACVDVLTRRAWDINGRQARQMRATASPGSDYLTRADGAAAWRGNIQTATASARRIMWWELPDGGIELAKVGVHDDVSIR